MFEFNMFTWKAYIYIVQARDKMNKINSVFNILIGVEYLIKYLK